MRQFVIVLLMVLVVGCGGAPTTTPPEQTQPAAPAQSTPDLPATVAVAAQATMQAQPTPNLPATVQAAVTATLQARAQAAAPTPTMPAAPTSPRSDTTTDVRVGVPEFTHYTHTIGAAVVQGIVENTDSVPAGNIDIAVSLVSDAGATVGAGQAIVRPTMLKPGAKAPWMAILAGAQPFKEVKVQVQARPIDDQAAAAIYQEFATEGVTVTPPAPPYNLPKISGRVVNTGSKVTSSVGVLVAVYGEDGRLLTVDSTTTKLDEIGPGRSAPFEFTFLAANEPINGQTIGRYDLFVEGVPKS